MSAFERYKTEKALNQLRAKFFNESGHLDAEVMGIFEEIRKDLEAIGYRLCYDNFNNFIRVV